MKRPDFGRFIFFDDAPARLWWMPVSFSGREGL
jgi:hypothetical protein